MRQLKFSSAVLMALILVGCGGGGSDIPAKPRFTSQVSFGDSLSDVGTYNVGEVAAAGGGQFSINGPNANGKAANGNDIINWTEVMAINLGLPAPCPAVTGLDDGTGVASGTNVTPVTHAGCTGYAQGGARVTAANGIHNRANNALGPTLGGHELTFPVVTQINNYLSAAPGNKFSGNEIVYVMAGANDLSFQLQVLVGGATAAGTAAANAAVAAQIAIDIGTGACVPADAQATNCQPAAIAALGGLAALQAIGDAAASGYLVANTPAVGLAMVTAATQLAGYVNTLILGNGATYVVVANMGDFASVPATAAYSQALKDTVITPLITAFNDTLAAALPSSSNLIYLDFYTSSKDEIANPAKYGLTNVTSQACDPVATPNDRALYCKASTLNSGLTADSHYLFADDQHPTPYGHALIAQGVLQAMKDKGWY